MSKRTTEAERTIGQRLRERRRELGLTLKDVAKSTGLSIGFISQIERDDAAPSLSSMVALSRTLKANISNFLNQPIVEASLTRQSMRPVYSVGANSRSYERVSTSFPGSKIRGLIIHEPPGHRGIPMSHEGEEILLFMLSGSLTVEVDGVASILQPGDALHFPSAKVHMIWNHSDVAATLLWVGTLDIFGEAPVDSA